MIDPASLPTCPGVYCIWLSNDAAYVGKTLNSIRCRVMFHVRASDRDRKSQVIHAAMKKHGCKRIDIIFTNGSPEQISNAEIDEIDRLTRAGVKLYNLTAGGDGTPGYKWGEVTRSKIVPALKASWTEERKSAAKAMHADPEFKAKFAKSHRLLWTEEKRSAQRDRLRENAPARKLTRENVEDIALLLKAGSSCASIGRKYGVTPEAISAIKTGKNWSYVTGF